MQKQTESTIELNLELSRIKELYRQSEYFDAVRLAEIFLKKLLYLVYWERYFKTKSPAQQKEILADIENVHLSGNVAEYTIEQFSKLFEITDCLTEIAVSPISDALVRSFDLKQTARLIDICKLPNTETNEKLQCFAMQQIVQICTLFSYLTDVITLQDDDFIDALVKKQSQEHTGGKSFGNLEQIGFKQKFFLYNEERGLLLNEADQTRNIAFKVETFGKLLGNIFEGVVKHLEKVPLEDRQPTKRIARDIIQHSGRESGRRFGKSLDQQFQREGMRHSLKDKIGKWCDFDSDVGFGRFSPEKLDLTNDEVSGTISLKENFLTLGRNYYDDNICCFMKGYIWGVLEELTGVPLIIGHKKKDCSQFSPGGDTCLFQISINTEEYEKRQRQLEEIDLSEEL